MTNKSKLKYLRMKIKPVARKTVIDPITNQALPETGKEVAANKYWHRRLRDGDVEHVSEINKAKKTSK